jgi:ABC-type transport system involved in multi-copper enzyme maturation permease subunit
MIEILRLQVRQILGGRKVWLVGFFLTAPVLLTAVIALWGAIPPDARPDPRLIYLFVLYPQALGILLALLYGASVLGNEIEGKTLTYLFTRPVGKWRVILGKYLAIVAILVPAILSSLLASWLLLGAPGGLRYLVGFVACTSASVCAYNAVFLIFGVAFPRRALVVCLLYAGSFEFLVSFVPAVINTVTVNYYLRSLTVRIVGLEIPSEAARVVGEASLAGSGAALGAITALALALACLVASRREYLMSEES